MGRNGDGEGGREALDRRKFLRMGMLGTVATAGGFSLVGNMAARAAAEDLSSRIVPKRKVASGLVQAGPELALQPGFSYKTLSLFGTAMSDGFLTPPLHDGMGVFPGPNGTYKLVRNHELGEGNDIPAGTVIGIPDYAYDKKSPGRHDDADRGLRRQPARLLHQHERHQHELLRNADPLGNLALVRGDGRGGRVRPGRGRTGTSSRSTRTRPVRRSTSR